MKNRKRSALVTSFVMMLAALMALSTATFAWFTNSNVAEVNQFQFTADAASGFQISLVTKGENNTVTYDGWKSTITNDDLNRKYSEQLSGNGKMIPVSAAKPNVTRGEFYAASFEKDGTAKIAQARPVDVTEDPQVAGYYAFEVAFWNQGSVTKEIVLHADSEIEKTTDSGKVLENAARVGFVSAETTTIWAVDGTAAKALNHATTGDDTAHVTDGFVDDTDYVTETKPENDRNKATVINLAADEKKIVKIYVWIEGQDAQCVNTNSGETVGVYLKFTVKTANDATP